jgi:C4-dicarboxylate transporter DctM subunit
MSEIAVGIIGIVALLSMILLGTPIGFALIVVGVLGFSYLVSPFAALSLLAKEIFLTLSSYSLAVLPLFFLMGQIAFQAGMSKRLFSTAYTWLGHLPCGLAMATIGGCAGFAAISGSSSATAATMSTVALPEMRKYDYDLRLATGSIAAGGTLGILIPPSVVLIIYGIQTEQSIGRLFVAGILPGILLSALFIVTIFIL